MGNKVLHALLIGLWRVGAVYWCRLCECNFAGMFGLCEGACKGAPFDHVFRVSTRSHAMSSVFRRTRLCNVGDRYV